MRRDLRIVLVAAGAWSTVAASCHGQSTPANPAPCTVAPQPAPCGSANAPASRPSNVDRFPFPEEDSGRGAATPAAPNAPATGSGSAAPQAPGAGGGSTGAGGSGAAFPFPGEPPAPAAGGGSSSSSSSSSGDDANPDATPGAGGLQDRGSEGSSAPQGRHLLHRVNPIGTKLQSADEREAEDLDVAHYYIESGDLKAAYMRSQDAVKTVPDDPEAHFALAEIALKLGKRDEAVAEYNACLKLDPVDKEAKAARKELAKLKP